MRPTGRSLVRANLCFHPTHPAPPTSWSVLQRLLGLRHDDPFAGDCVSPLSSARYAYALVAAQALTPVWLVFILQVIASVSPVNSGGTVVLVSQDGIQRPPLHFPKGGHLLQFLTCLETGLLPHGQLDPPLWNQRGKVRGHEDASLANSDAETVGLHSPTTDLPDWTTAPLRLYSTDALLYTGKGFPQTAEEESTQLLRLRIR